VRIAFVFAPYRHKAFEENVTIVDDEFGRFPPINLATAAAIAEQAGHEVMVLDANVLGLEPDEAAKRLASFRPDLLGAYVTTYMFRDTLSYIRRIRASLRVPLIVGGVNMLLYPKETLSHSVVDYGLVGHAIDSLPPMLAAIEAGELPRGIPGACYREEDGEIVVEPQDNGPIDFGRFPFPARHMLPMDRYYSFISQRKPFTNMMTALGCPWSCTFCAIAPMPFSMRPAEQVVEEFTECHERHGIREIDIFDADFPYDRERTAAICEGLIAADLDVEWSVRSRIGSVDPELLELMARAGLRQIYYGIETPDPKALARMKKPLAPKKIKPILQATMDVGVRPLGFFMLGVPGETRRSMMGTIRYSQTLGLDFAQYSRTIAKPMTQLYQDQVRVTGEDYWRRWVLGSAQERRMGSHWTELGESEIELWTKLAYYSFYFRPHMVVRALARMRSSEEMMRSARVALKMLQSFAERDPR